MKRTIITLIALVSTACAAHQDRYVQQVQETEVPQDEPGRKSLCGWLRGEEARQTSIAATAQGQYAGLMIAIARQHIAALDQKKAEAACDMPFMPEQHSAPIVVPAAPLSTKRNSAELENCVATCQKMTSADAATCFKDCSQ
jgi:hypothetical protein